MNITYIKDYHSLSNFASSIVAEYIVSGNKNIGLPTGNTPLGLYECLVSKNLDWSTTKTFNLDDYIDCDYPHTFHYYMMSKVFSKTNIPMKNIYFPIHDYSQSLVSWYDCTIEDSGGLDLTVLGIGVNGHLAYNEPGSPFDWVTREVKLTDSTRQQLIPEFGSIEKVPNLAVTMGLATIMESRRILLLAHGVKKLSILKQSLWGPITIEVPASILQKHNDVTVLYCD